MKNNSILILGANGQIGSELVNTLQLRHGMDTVIASDIKASVDNSSNFEILDVLNKEQIKSIFEKYKITHIYHLAALLSATGEKNPKFAWQLNMDGLFNILDAALEYKVERIFWPSSIAVFGPNTPRQKTPQLTVMDPTTVYGISKLAGERWCEYYHQKKGLDIRSIRYPGLISYTSLPGGGTTDYAVDIYYEALRAKSYTCFLKKDTTLPMMFMPDAIRGTIELMEADESKLSVRSSYNFSGISFSPEEIAGSIKKEISGFKIDYKPDYRQDIAASWPESIDDYHARHDWGWKPEYDLQSMTRVMLEEINKKGI